MRKHFVNFKTLGSFNRQLNLLYREKLKVSTPKLILKSRE